jgi:hypothetical protein
MLPPKTDPRHQGGCSSAEILIFCEKRGLQTNLRYLRPTIEETELKPEGEMWMWMALPCCRDRSKKKGINIIQCTHSGVVPR